MITGFGFAFAIAILIMSVVAHEVAHGYAAERLGDPTARYAGRLTLNPLKHLDLVGSFIIPTLTFFLGGFIIGWAKPVPYNPYNMRDPRAGGAIVAAAGPLTNVVIAVLFGLLIRFSAPLGLPEAFITIAGFVVLINIVLAFFNSIPVPPLDGSKVLFALLPYHLRGLQETLEQYWFIALPVIILLLWQFFIPVISFFFRLLTGAAFF